MKTNRSTLIDACYQYLLDHTIPTPKGDCVSFILVPKGEFRRRIHAREKGYKRVSQEELINDPMKIRDSLPMVKRARKYVEKMQKNNKRVITRNEIEKSGNWLDRIVVRIRRMCDTYLNKKISAILSQHH